MADPFQIAAAAAGCVDICLRVYYALDKLASEARNADTTAADLKSRVGRAPGYN